MVKSGEKWGKMGKSGKKLEKVVESEEKWGKVGKSGEKWRKVAKSGEKWGKVEKSIRWSSLYLFWWTAYIKMLSRNLVIRNFDVLVCTVGSVGPPVSCLGVWSSTINNDAIADLFAEVLNLLCRARYPYSSLELGQQLICQQFIRTHSKLELQKHVFLARTQLDWKLQKHWLRYVPTSHLSSLLLSLMLTVGRQRLQDPNFWS